MYTSSFTQRSTASLLTGFKARLATMAKMARSTEAEYFRDLSSLFKILPIPSLAHSLSKKRGPAQGFAGKKHVGLGVAGFFVAAIVS